MIKFNFRDVGGKDRYDDLNRAIDKASKANIGIVAMKTQSGEAAFPATRKELEEKGVKVKNLHPTEKRVVSPGEGLQTGSRRDQDRLDGRPDAGRRQRDDQPRPGPRERRRQQEPVTEKEAASWKSTEGHGARYCHGCGHLCETAAKGVPVATVLRYYRYYEAYGKREQARALYQALPEASRRLDRRQPPRRRGRMPFGLPVADLVRQADRRLS